MARGYSNYRGRRPKWKTLVVVLLVLIILVAVGFMALQRFIVYDDMGVPQMTLPGMERPQSPTPQLEEVDITIEEGEPEQQTAIQTLQAVQLGDDPAAWGETLANSSRQAFCVTVKAAGGQLRYPFDASVAGQVRADTAAAAGEALRALLNGDGHSIARISCLRDGSVARANVETMGLKNTGGFVFYDGNNENWLDPAKEATRSYLSALAVECADLGFDEILLTDLSYPTAGKLDKIAYGDPGSETQAAWNAEQIAQLVTAVKTALGDRDVQVSIEVPETVLQNGGVDEIAGIDLRGALQEQLSRVYVPTTAEKAETLSAMLPEGMLVPELTAAPADESQSYLLLNP